MCVRSLIFAVAAAINSADTATHFDSIAFSEIHGICSKITATREPMTTIVIRRDGVEEDTH